MFIEKYSYNVIMNTYEQALSLTFIRKACVYYNEHYHELKHEEAHKEEYDNKVKQYRILDKFFLTNLKYFTMMYITQGDKTYIKKITFSNNKMMLTYTIPVAVYDNQYTDTISIRQMKDSFKIECHTSSQSYINKCYECFYLYFYFIHLRYIHHRVVANNIFHFTSESLCCNITLFLNRLLHECPHLGSVLISTYPESDLYIKIADLIEKQQFDMFECSDIKSYTKVLGFQSQIKERKI